MTLGIRKIIVLGIIGAIFLMANILIVANWIAEKGLPEKANWLCQEFLTGTAIAVIIALLILLVNPKASSRAASFMRRCPVCDKRLFTKGGYCSECGSRI